MQKNIGIGITCLLNSQMLVSTVGLTNKFRTSMVQILDIAFAKLEPSEEVFFSF